MHVVFLNMTLIYCPFYTIGASTLKGSNNHHQVVFHKHQNVSTLRLHDCMSFAIVIILYTQMLYTHIQKRTHKCYITRTHARTYARAHARMHTHTHNMHACTHTCKDVSIHTSKYSTFTTLPIICYYKYRVWVETVQSENYPWLCKVREVSTLVQGLTGCDVPELTYLTSLSYYVNRVSVPITMHRLILFTLISDKSISFTFKIR